MPEIYVALHVILTVNGEYRDRLIEGDVTAHAQLAIGLQEALTRNDTIYTARDLEVDDIEEVK